MKGDCFSDCRDDVWHLWDHQYLVHRRGVLLVKIKQPFSEPVTARGPHLTPCCSTHFSGAARHSPPMSWMEAFLTGPVCQHPLRVVHSSGFRWNSSIRVRPSQPLTASHLFIRRLKFSTAVSHRRFLQSVQKSLVSDILRVLSFCSPPPPRSRSAHSWTLSVGVHNSSAFRFDVLWRRVDLWDSPELLLSPCPRSKQQTLIMFSSSLSAGSVRQERRWLRMLGSLWTLDPLLLMPFTFVCFWLVCLTHQPAPPPPRPAAHT